MKNLKIQNSLVITLVYKWQRKSKHTATWNAPQKQNPGSTKYLNKWFQLRFTNQIGKNLKVYLSFDFCIVYFMPLNHYKHENTFMI